MAKAGDVVRQRVSVRAGVAAGTVSRCSAGLKAFIED